MKTVIGIATYKREKYLEKALESLKGQADDILVYDNAREKKDYKANAKFIFLNSYSDPVYYFTCDDDIIYPPDYIKNTVEAIERYSSIVTYHGDILLNQRRGMYPEFQRFHFKHTRVVEPKKIDVAGTALTAFRTDYFNPKNIYKNKHQNMVDQLFSLEAAKQGKQITLLPHEKDTFIIQPVPENETIWGQHENKRPKQIQLANNILRIKGANQN